MKKYKLVDGNGMQYESEVPGTLGGNSRDKIYGSLKCPAAIRNIGKGYEKHRIFFSSEEDAINAGYRPCGACMKDAYKVWKEKTEKLNIDIDGAGAMVYDLSTKEYVDALTRNELTNTQKKLLEGWITESQSMWATPTFLKKIMGYSTSDRVNIDVGNIGKKIIESLNLDIDKYIVENKRTIYWAVYCDVYDGVKGWHLSENFREAAQKVLAIK